MIADLEVLLVREVEGFGSELALFPDDETVWMTVPGVANAAGNLTLHVAGNIRHYVGTVLGGTGFVRDRATEFSRRSGSRRALVADLADAAATVREVLRRLSPECLDVPFPHVPVSGEVSTRRFLMHLAVHAGYHLGQVGYLRRMLTQDDRVSGAMGLAPLAGR